MGRCLQWREQYTKQPSSILEKNIASKRNQKTEFMVGKKIINIRVHPYKVGNIKIEQSVMLKGRFLNLKKIEIHLKMIDCKLTLHEPVRKITPSKIWLYLKKKEEEINTLTKSIIEYLQSAEEKMAI